MIPVSLTLKNFMSYGEEGQTLSFEGMHVACLSGDNGNGKSALLDAMTWALWGKSRASSVQSVSEDDLIRRGADEAEVRFEFELNEQRYRIVKKRRRGKPGDWQLAQMLAEDQFVSIGGGGSKEVSKQIVQLLSMEYETFLSSAYLQQGHADEFTRQKPADRKRILSEILGLERYDRLEARARDRSRELKTIIDDLDGQLRILEGQIGRRPGFQAELGEVQALLAALAREQKEKESALAHWREQRVLLDQLQQQKAGLESAAKRTAVELAEAEAAHQKQKERVRRIGEYLEQRASILQDYEALQQARRRREHLEPEVEEFNAKTSDLQQVLSAIEVEKTRLYGELKTVEQHVKLQERNRAEFERLQVQVAALKAELANEPEVTKAYEQTGRELDLLKEAFEALKARNKELTDALHEHDEVLELLGSPRAACPVCESDLSGAKRERVLARQKEKRDAMLETQAQIKREGVRKSDEVKAMQAQFLSLSNQRDDFTAKRSRLQEMVRQSEPLACAPAELEIARKQLNVLRSQLESEDYAHPKRVMRQRLEQDLLRLRSAKADFEAAAGKIRTLADAETRYGNLQRAEESILQEQEELERRGAICVSKSLDLKEQNSTIESLACKLKGHAEIDRQTEQAEVQFDRLQRELDNARRTEGSLLGALHDCDNAQKQCVEKESERKKVSQEQWAYDKLAGCFGRRGIQALIIENAIPELEEEANDLLARMTDNGMQVRFLTTRAGRTSKSEIETLDISITDDVGARPYEMFSGGEAFRVNFAIRIALSRLLAHRSGARLQTLILDEGFGTQDGKGREKLVEAIEAIKSDFEKILVITHVEELKDAFPQRIEVSKDGRGSRIYVL